MASIKILEKDLTNPGSSAANTNVVYIPGYAITGPINEPILCETVDQFKRVFGDKPYLFETQQHLPKNEGENKNGFSADYYQTDVYAQKDDPEKSYLYALELLNSGLPILFERLFKLPEDNEKSVYATATIPMAVPDDSVKLYAKYPGKYGNNITFTVGTADVTKIAKDTLYTLDLSIKGAYGVLDSSEHIEFTLNPENANYIGRIVSDIVDVEAALKAVNTISAVNFTQETGEGKLSENLALESADTEFTVIMHYSNLEKAFNKLTDKNMYDIKFITSGSYPVLGYKSDNLVRVMAKVAGDRGDAVAIIDHTNIEVDEDFLTNKIRTITFETSSIGEDSSKYAAMFTPWGTYALTAQSDFPNVILPASFGYLKCLSSSVKTNDNWYAVAGVTRGLVTGLLQPCYTITGAMADEFQKRDKISINPITNIRPYGYCIWGNRTLFNNVKNGNLTASSFLNIRMLSNDVKKVVYQAAKKLTFELNNDILWLNFKAAITPTLDKMVSGNGLSNYKIIRQASTEKATIKCVIKLYAIEAVEDWDITIELSDSYVSVQ